MVPRAHALGGGWRAQGIGNVNTGPEHEVGFLAADPLFPSLAWRARGSSVLSTVFGRMEHAVFRGHL